MVPDLHFPSSKQIVEYLGKHEYTTGLNCPKTVSGQTLFYFDMLAETFAETKMAEREFYMKAKLVVCNFVKDKWDWALARRILCCCPSKYKEYENWLCTLTAVALMDCAQDYKQKNA